MKDDKAFWHTQGDCRKHQSKKKRIVRGNPWVVHVHNTRCFVNTDHIHTVALMGVSPQQVRINFDRPMAVVNRQDSRSYVQVVLQPCASTLSHFLHMVNNKGLHNTKVSGNTIYADNTVQSVDKTAHKFSISNSHGDKQLINSDSGLNAAHFPRGMHLDTCISGRNKDKNLAGQVGPDPFVVPIKNRFLLLSKSDAGIESQEIGDCSNSDLTKVTSPSNAIASNR